MRYIQREPVLTTVSDKEVSDDAEMREILTSIKQHNQDVGIEFIDPESDAVRTLDRVRITEVKPEGAIDIHAFFPQSSARFRNISFYNIRRISMIASRQVMSRKYKVSRWQMLDVADLGE